MEKKVRKPTETEVYRNALASLRAMRHQLEGVVDDSADPAMQEAAGFLDRIDAYLHFLIEMERVPDEICPRCGVNMQATHAPWCQASDGTPVPDEDVPTMYALARCKRFIKIMAESAMGDDRFLWALSDLLKHLAEWVYPLRQPF